MPFWSDSELEIDFLARKEDLPFQPHNSPEVVDLLRACCHKDPASRPTIN
jgi:hypothetical protein